ncbi:MAG TPA: glutamate racemase [Saprospiraceae bacterium]|nr:glutamate racemase [Saprospiraceae bacterium]
MTNTKQPIGMMDSGIGGLTVANAVFRLLPNEDYIYFADAGHIPYGNKTVEQIQQYCLAITDFFLKKNCKAIVVACNTATAAALPLLRKTYPEIPFIGMEPAVKPAVSHTRTHTIGVLATTGTISSKRYKSLTRKYANDIRVLQNPCTGLVPMIEAGKKNDPDVRALLQRVLSPMLEKNADTFVLGCTHYPFVRSVIERLVPKEATIIDPAPAIARQVRKILGESGKLTTNQNSQKQFFTTGNKKAMEWGLSEIMESAISEIIEIELLI